MSQKLGDLLNHLSGGEVAEVLVGLHWTSVVVETENGPSCGLASSLSKPHNLHGHEEVPCAGSLDNHSATTLAFLAESDEPALASVGLAAINAMLANTTADWIDQNAEDVIARNGAGRRVALIGRFPFINRLRSQVGELQVLEHHPLPGDCPASAAPEILPQADVVAITGTTLINHSLDELLTLCPSKALVILLGPSTPLSPVLFDHGVDILCGSVVTSIHPVLKAIGQGGNFRQVRRAGVRTVTMARPGYN